MEERRKTVQYYDKKAVGSRIKQQRKSRNMTQSDLAIRLDYANERQLQRIESGETACSVDKLMEISQILNISADFLLFGVEQSREDDFADIFAGKSERQIIYLKKLLVTAAENLDLLELHD